MSTIYVVMGDTGEYSDHTEWVDEQEVIEGRDESLNRAVCLAIIKSQGEP